MVELLTGVEQMQDYSDALSRQLARTAERFGLDTAETEALTQLGSMEMVSRSQNISHVVQTLTSGWKESDWTTSRRGLSDAVIVAGLQAIKEVRAAAVLRMPGKHPKVTAYLGR